MFEGKFDGLEFLLGTVGEVGDGAMFDFAVLAEGLAEEDPVIGLAIELGFGAVEINSEHVIIKISAPCKTIIDYISAISGYIVGTNSS